MSLAPAWQSPEPRGCLRPDLGWAGHFQQLGLHVTVACRFLSRKQKEAETAEMGVEIQRWRDGERDLTDRPTQRRRTEAERQRQGDGSPTPAPATPPACGEQYMLTSFPSLEPHRTSPPLALPTTYQPSSLPGPQSSPGSSVNCQTLPAGEKLLSLLGLPQQPRKLQAAAHLPVQMVGAVVDCKWMRFASPPSPQAVERQEGGPSLYASRCVPGREILGCEYFIS